jgi:carbamate kinase
MHQLSKSSEEIIVLALGGNAIATKSRTFDSQYNAIRDATKEISSLAKNGYKIVITHGNGPQVGDALLRNECAKELAPPLPLYACVAGTQGVLGSMIQTALLENLGNDVKIVSIVTKVLVSEEDPAFKNPTKPIGTIFTKKDLHKINKVEPSASFKEITPGKYRRVVPSPEPISILEMDAIKKLVEDGFIVIACGGGGIPVINKKQIYFTEAVIDKDLASEVLATSIGASMFVNLTDVAGVYINFRSKNRKLLQKIQVDKMKELLEDGNFEEGSMEPKVRAAVRFVTNTGKNAVISSIGKAREAIELKSGTIVYK